MKTLILAAALAVVISAGPAQAQPSAAELDRQAWEAQGRYNQQQILGNIQQQNFYNQQFLTQMQIQRQQYQPLPVLVPRQPCGNFIRGFQAGRGY